jgi:hypothetical protein
MSFMSLIADLNHDARATAGREGTMSDPFEVCFCAGPLDGQRRTVEYGCEKIVVALEAQPPVDLSKPYIPHLVPTVGKTAIYRPLKGQTRNWYYEGVEK